MNEKNQQITSNQLMLFISSLQIGIGSFILPNAVTKKSGHDAWLAVLLTGILCNFIIILILALLKRYRNKNIYSITKLLYGKFLGTLFNILILFYLFFSSSLYLRIFTNMIKTSSLKVTPSIIISAFVMIPTLYLTYAGLKFVERYSIFILLTIFFSILFFTLLLGNIRITFLMPFGECGIKGLLGGIWKCLFVFLGYEIILFVYPNIIDKEKSLKRSIEANIISCIFFLIVILILTSYLGENMVKRSVYPLIELSRSYNAPVFERIDLFFISIWFPTIAMSVRGYFCVTYYGILNFLKLKNNPLTLGIYFIIVLLSSRIPNNVAEILMYANMLGIYAGALLLFILICYIFSFINRRGVNNNDKTSSQKY